MFDISGSEFLIVAILALLLIGPKELPGFLRTVGRYMGIVRRHAAEFKAHFDEAMREAELQGLREEAERLRKEIAAPLEEADREIRKADRSPAAPKPEAKGEEPGKPPEPPAAAGSPGDARS